MADFVTREESLSQYGTEAYTGWGKKEAEADFKAKGGTPGTGDAAGNDFASIFAKLVGSPVELPPLQVKSFEEYDKQALEELRPYYERILKEEGGDVEKAKLRIGQDYERGLRINREDYQTAKAGYGSQIQPGETIQQYYNRAKSEPGTFPQEGIALLDQIAKRGMLNSGFAKTDAANLATAQERRQEAIKTALSRYEEQSGITKGRTLEDIGTQWGRRQFELEQQKRTEAGTIGRQKRADEISTQEIERSNIMRKAIQNLYG